MVDSKHRTAATRRTASAVSLVVATFACSATAGTEIAVRFFDDNRAAKSTSLSATAHGVVERTAGTALIARGRDADGAFRFTFASEPSASQIRDALNKLRATGAVVYADIASDDRGVRAK